MVFPLNSLVALAIDLDEGPAVAGVHLVTGVDAEIDLHRDILPSLKSQQLNHKVSRSNQFCHHQIHAITVKIYYVQAIKLHKIIRKVL